MQHLLRNIHFGVDRRVSTDQVIDDDALFKLVKKAPAASIQLLLVRKEWSKIGRALQIPLRSRKNISPRLV